MTRRRYLEDELHLTVAAYLDLALPIGVPWTTIEAGGRRGMLEAVRLRRKGVKRGWPDILIFWRPVICIELKSPTGRLSPAQKAVHKQLKCSGALVYTARQVEEVEGFLLGAGVPLRATTAPLRATTVPLRATRKPN